MDLKTHSYQCTVQWTMQGLMEPFLNIFGCCNFTEAKICEACTVLLGNGLFLKNQMTQKKKKKKKRSIWPMKKMSIWSIVHHFRLLGWADFGSKFTKFDRICIIACTRQPHSSCCKERVECLSFHVPCFEAVV